MVSRASELTRLDKIVHIKITHTPKNQHLLTKQILHSRKKSHVVQVFHILIVFFTLRVLNRPVLSVLTPTTINRNNTVRFFHYGFIPLLLNIDAYSSCAPILPSLSSIRPFVNDSAQNSVGRRSTQNRHALRISVRS